MPVGPFQRVSDVAFFGQLPEGMEDLPYWTRRVVDAVNQLPAFSIFSTSDGPNGSGETADRGTIGIDVGSSATTVLWVATSSGTNTWRAIG